MAKSFMEAIPNLQVTEDLQEALKTVEVEKVVLSRDRTDLRIYILSKRLIPKKNIYILEANIKKQMFPRKEIVIKIVEKYQLSSQYTPEKLLEAYRDSILLELKHYSMLDYQMFRKAEVAFPEPELLEMTITEGLVQHRCGDELKRVLEKVFNERCGFGIEVQCLYKVAEKRKEEEDPWLQPAPAGIDAGAGACQGWDGGQVLMAADDEPLPWNDASGADGGQAAVKQSLEKAQGGANQGTQGGSNQGTKGRANQGTKAGSGQKKSGWEGGKKKWQPKGGFSRKKSDNPDVLFGRDFDADPIRLSELVGEMGEVTVGGQIIAMEERELRTGNFMVLFDIYDGTDTITVKMFSRADRIDEIRGVISKGMYVCVKGIAMLDRFDGELSISSVSGIKKGQADSGGKRKDNSEKKRVELHCHTKMSEMDAVGSVEDILKRAMEWGHTALAITDHGVVQGFTEAYHMVGDKDPFKVIYGMEGYLVDDKKEMVVRSAGQSLEDDYVVFDLETTGLTPLRHEIIEIGAVKVREGKIIDRFSTFVNPRTPISYEIENLTGINDDMVIDAPGVEEALPEFLNFCQGCAIVAHNADFDVGFVSHKAQNLGMEFAPTVVDTVSLARLLMPSLKRFKLDTIAKHLNISLENHHRAVDDAECTALIFLEFIKMLKKRGIKNLDQLNEAGQPDPELIKKLPMYHVIILVKNDTGRINLYRLVSESHITYYARRPRIPKTLLEQYREGLIIGSACEAGELFQAVRSGADDAEISRLVKFYDYLEIQPVGNNQFMLRDEKYGLHSEEDLRDLNRKIVALGEQFQKPVVATCDVHFIDPEDEIYRRIILAGKGFADAENQPPLFLRTTEEMLEEFQYLGSEKAEEVVITNSNLIADQCEKIAPVRPDKCPPVIPNSDKDLRDICYGTARKKYGDDLPKIVVERLERELNSIISNGFAVMYIIAQKLVDKSNADGYLVGSRGSVGSSFVATMANITEVNPLSPHYYCPSCHYYDFDSEEVKSFSGMGGCDMPDKNCPVCGEKLKKDGFDIPFETFLGFKGNKEPDIDLNFSGEYQSQAHDYTEVIFGKGHTFRAGTIGTLADKTAFGYVKNYFEEKGQHKRKCEISRIVQGCVGVKRTTGQHPGGIIVMPHGEEIYSFTPIQHPANDMNSDIVTTHFDYHSIDHNLLKLDILGHDDPTMIRMLEDITGLNARDIPLDSPEVMSLFRNTSALGITPDDIGGCQLGALGVPEFGTDFAMQMLLDTKPKYFSDLVRIAGLAHGTDVWLGNAQTLILEGTATIQTAICTRDDIMTYLIHKGMESELSFTIMESVRKGKGLKPEWEEAMKAADVPDWYIGSCKKIKYMFPKAHAAAYVMMAWRIAYCKIFYPLAYYAAFFSIRASGFSYELMCQGRSQLERNLENYRRNQDKLTKKEQDSLRDMRIVQEMYARGYEFMPIDIYRAKASRFQVIDGKIMPSLSSIDGLGDKAADAVVEAVQDGPFLSKEDFWQRTKVPKSVIDLMSDMGLFGDLPNTNQISLFDFELE